MLQIKENDFQAIDSFPIKWRWTDSRWNKLPVESLNKIQPFTENKAREICQYSLRFCEEGKISKSLFEHIEQMRTSIEESEVQHWLFSRSSNSTQTVIVSWNERVATLVEWKVFCKYWNDFCYPASDDVTIFPLSEEWILLYSHEECFDFGKSRNSTVQPDQL